MSTLAAADTPLPSGMAGRYATALFDLTVETGSVDSVLAELQKFTALLGESPDLARLVRSPAFGAEAQLRAVTAVMERAGITGLAAKVIKVLARNRRLFAVADVISAYRALAARHRGEVSAQVTVAETISEAHLRDIKDTLDAVTGKDVKIDVRINPAIIGGLIVKLGSRMVDSSLRTKLNGLRLAMKEVG
jgi:F-type H+-transporting ATPase subunit delta